MCFAGARSKYARALTGDLSRSFLYTFQLEFEQTLAGYNLFFIFKFAKIIRLRSRTLFFILKKIIIILS